MKALGLLLVLATPGVAATSTVCPGITVTGDEEIKLTDSERKLVCGDRDTRAWSEIPLKQAAYFLRNFLGDRGYHRPVETLTATTLHVATGKQAQVRDVLLDAPGIDIDVTRYWPIRGRAMTPKALDELEKWLKTQLSRQAMPCARVELVADPDSEMVTVRLRDTTAYLMPQVKAEKIPEVNGAVQERYYAFETGEPYDSLELELSARRMINDEIVLNTSFTTDCVEGGKEITVSQKMVPGAPRLIGVGVGVDTEEFLIGEASWKHMRLGPAASGVRVTARASYRKQQARVVSDWYYAPVITRHFLRSTLSYERQNERRYDTRSTKAQVGPQWNRDIGFYYGEVFAGFAYEHTETARGEGPATSASLTTEVETILRSHDFEYYRTDPRTGHEIDVDVLRASKDVGADFSAMRTHVVATALWNAFALDPPVWILGLRGEFAATTVMDDTLEDEVPVTFRNFLGGSENLRGFGRKAVPNDDDGALTAAYLGTEARIANSLPYKLQPIVFVDFGRIGGNELTLEPTLYWSPGAGLHWQSPIGTLRTTLAHGMIDGPLQEELVHQARWQFYLSFGEQF